MKIALVSLLFICSLAQRGKNDISVENIKKTYSMCDTLQIILVNEAQVPLFYYIGIECNINDEWREVVNDASNPKSKSSFVLKLSANEKKSVFLFVNTTLKDFIPRFDTYRLVVNYGNTIDSINKYAYSQFFKIVN